MRLSYSLPQLVLFLLVMIVFSQDDTVCATTDDQQYQQITVWADLIGKELFNFAKTASRRQEAISNFNKGGARVLPIKGFCHYDKEPNDSIEGCHEILFSIAKEIEKMMSMKKTAVRNLVERAEFDWTQSPYVERTWPLYEFKDAKRLNISNLFKHPYLSDKIELKKNGHFFGYEVNTSFSAVHVPTHVYDGEPRILRGIDWSKGLDEVFVENYRRDPSLYWQYFGSSLGFMRRYPASWWDPKPAGEVDLFDCRTRAWYIEAATSPKDVLILVDNSGSMTGHKRDLARQVAFEILETLGSNDFVNILSFNITVREVVPCFKDKLVQANLANIRDLKMGMEALEKPFNFSYFPVALNEAFQLLENVRLDKRGSNCNQAIMLITDGSPETFEEVFKRWNWLHIPQIPVRVFTYLLGADAEMREVKWMACANRGYFSHISRLSEVREQVMHYISVMARPLVLNNTYHPVVWAPVYADIIDPKMTDYLWELKEREIQKGISHLLRTSRVYRNWKAGLYKKKKQKDKTLKEIANMAIKESDIKDDREYLIDTSIKRYPYKMMTSISMPVYDTRENSTVEANILGVAGTDIPNFEIQRMMVPHLLGVNGYAFIVTNNGYLLIHPELRPEFQVSINGEIVSILKPNYNNVDFLDVEQAYNGQTKEKDDFEDEDWTTIKWRHTKTIEKKKSCRKDDPQLMTLRDHFVNGSYNGSSTLNIMNTHDGLRRVSLGKRNYFYTNINDTPFELVVALPETYGMYRIEPKPELPPRLSPRRRKHESLLKDNLWKIHPNWYYCKYYYKDKLEFKTPEEELLHFLNKTSQPGWKWSKITKNSPEHYHCHICNTFKEENGQTDYYCDRALLQSLMFDVKSTEWFTETMTLDPKHKLLLTLVFIATRSGLTRWQDVCPHHESATGDGSHFSEIYKSAIDETWYKRAVEQYLINSTDFVYSVPFKNNDKNEILVTGSQAVFLNNGSYESPVAVIGFQFKHSSLHSLFINITYCSYEYKTVKSVQSCESNNIHCYILDDHGYIIVSENINETGQFFGQIQGDVMEKMITDKLYKRIDVHDYQAVCFVIPPKKPLEKSYFDNKLYINRTRPIPCETKITLYSLDNKNLKKGITSINCSRPYFAKDIPHSNLVLIVVNNSCPINKKFAFFAQSEEVNYNPEWCCKSDRDLPRRNVADCMNYNEMEEFIVNVCGEATILKIVPIYVIVISLIIVQKNVII